MRRATSHVITNARTTGSGEDAHGPFGDHAITIAITLDTYSHVTPTMQREAAAAMDAVLAR